MKFFTWFFKFLVAAVVSIVLMFSFPNTSVWHLLGVLSMVYSTYAFIRMIISGFISAGKAITNKGN